MLRKVYEEMEEPIHAFFGLSYANYLVIPRTVLQSMPLEWQRRFVDMVDEMQKKFGHLIGEIEYDVTTKDSEGNLVNDHLADYERGRRRLEEQTDG